MHATLPKLPIVLDDAQNLAQFIEREEALSTASFQDEDISGLQTRGVEASELKLEKVNFSQAKLDKSDFTDVQLSGCELAATTFADSGWRRVLVEKSRCSGIQLQNTFLKDVTFVGCKLNMANFRFAKLINVCFKDCDLEEADFYMAELTNVSFEACTLNKLEFSSSTLKKVDLRTSVITDVTGIRNLSGAIIDSTQLIALAPTLAQGLGIQVKDE